MGEGDSTLRIYEVVAAAAKVPLPVQEDSGEARPASADSGEAKPEASEVQEGDSVRGDKLLKEAAGGETTDHRLPTTAQTAEVSAPTATAETVSAPVPEPEAVPVPVPPVEVVTPTVEEPTGLLTPVKVEEKVIPGKFKPEVAEEPEEPQAPEVTQVSKVPEVPRVSQAAETITAPVPVAEVTETPAEATSATGISESEALPKAEYPYQTAPEPIAPTPSEAPVPASSEEVISEEKLPKLTREETEATYNKFLEAEIEIEKAAIERNKFGLTEAVANLFELGAELDKRGDEHLDWNQKKKIEESIKRFNKGENLQKIARDAIQTIEWKNQTSVSLENKVDLSRTKKSDRIALLAILEFLFGLGFGTVDKSMNVVIDELKSSLNG